MIPGLHKTCFVLGCQRSGTTLMGHMLAAAGSAVLIDESDGLYDWLHQNSTPHQPLASPPTGILEKSRAKYTDPAARFEAGGDGAIRLAAHIDMLVLKANNLTFDLQTLFARAGDNIIVFPVRDPRSVVASMLRHPVDFVGNQRRLLQASPLAAEHTAEIAALGDDTRPLWERMALVWRIKTGLYRAALAGPLPAHMLRYEDLVIRPELELQKLCATTGMEFSPAMLTHHGMYQGRSQGAFDRTRAIDTASADRWRTDLTQHQQARILDIAGPLCDTLGYRAAAS